MWKCTEKTGGTKDVLWSSRGTRAQITQRSVAPKWFWQSWLARRRYAMWSITICKGRENCRMSNTQGYCWICKLFVHLRTHKKQRGRSVLSWTVNSLLQRYLDFLMLIPSARRGCWKWEQIILQKGKKKRKEKKITSINLQAIQDLLVFSLQIKNTCQADFQHSVWWGCSKIMMNIKKTLSNSVQLCIWSWGKRKKKQHQNQWKDLWLMCFFNSNKNG